MKTGRGTAIYTAECGHAFHFPCIAVHVSDHSSLACPVCNAAWKDVPVLAPQNDVVAAVQSTPEKIETKHSDSVRSYDDDEPLPSPFSGAQIAPIPEADENDDDEDQNDEFQGFFVNPKKPPLNEADYRSVRVKLMPECAVISASQSHETYALVLRVKAPPQLPSRSGAAQPVDLVAVVDVGSGMSGAKLHMLKRAMRLVISSLGSADRLSMVASSASSERLMPLRRMTAQGQRVARRVVGRLVSGHGTAATGEALRKASKVLEDRRKRNPVASVVLFSETSNYNDQRKCFSFSHVSSSRFTFIEIPVHSFGFGNQAGFSVHPAEDDFAKRVDGILSAVVQDLRIQLGVSAQAEIRAVYSCNNGRPTALGSGALRLGDLYAEEERELLVELRVPRSALGTRHVMNVRCIYKDPVNQETVCGREHVLPVALRHGGRAEKLKNVFITSRAMAESRRLMECNEFSSACCLVASARELLAQCGSASAEEYMRGLEAELADIQWRKGQKERQGRVRVVDDSGGEVLTPTSAWRAAEKLAKMASMKKSLNRVSDLHGFENARF